MVQSTKPSVFIFDLHEVLVQKKHATMFFKSIKYMYRLDLLLYIMHPKIILQLFKLFSSSKVPEHYAFQLAQHHNKLSPLIPIIIEIMNEQKVVAEIIPILKELKKQQFSLYLFSNVGEQTFHAFKKKFPELCSFFDLHIVAQPHDNWIQKPQKASFEKCLTIIKKSAHECFFIDNCKKNIATAQDLGFHTILYSSPYLLKKRLAEANIQI